MNGDPSRCNSCVRVNEHACPGPTCPHAHIEGHGDPRPLTTPSLVDCVWTRGGAARSGMHALTAVGAWLVQRKGEDATRVDEGLGGKYGRDAVEWLRANVARPLTTEQAREHAKRFFIRKPAALTTMAGTGERVAVAGMQGRENVEVDDLSDDERERLLAWVQGQTYDQDLHEPRLHRGLAVVLRLSTEHAKALVLAAGSS